MTQLADLDGPHWQFALELYDDQDVATACLSLQDRWNFDVIIMIVALYGAIKWDRTPTREELSQIDAEIADWRSTVVQPLRTIRRRLKAMDYGPAAKRLRDVIKSSELRSEQIELATLAQHVVHFSGPPATTDKDLYELILMLAEQFSASVTEANAIKAVAEPIVLRSVYLRKNAEIS